ncbi:MAG: sphingosine kinase, partial [Actinomycetota bacterium]
FFLGVLSAGFDSFVNERANRMTWPKGKARYVVAITGELRTFRPVEYTAVLDGREIREGAMLVAVGNGVSYGGGMKVCPGAVPDDGLLDITWLHAVSTPTFIRVFPSVFSGTHVNKPFVSTYRAREIELSAPGQLAYADGERVGPLPISIRSRPGALSVIVPGRSA